MAVAAVALQRWRRSGSCGGSGLAGARPTCRVPLRTYDVDVQMYTQTSTENGNVRQLRVSWPIPF